MAGPSVISESHGGQAVSPLQKVGTTVCRFLKLLGGGSDAERQRQKERLRAATEASRRDICKRRKRARQTEADWHFLTYDLRHLVLSKLTAADRCTVARVCSEWNIIVRSLQTALAVDLNQHSLEDFVPIPTILAAVDHRPHLSRLSVRLCYEEHYATLAALVHRCTGLQALQLVPWQRTTLLPAAVCVVLCKLSFLRMEKPERLPHYIGCLRSLTRLDLMLGEYSRVSLPQYGFIRLTSLQELRASCSTYADVNASAPLLHGVEMLATMRALRRVDFCGLCFPDLEWVQRLRQVTRLGLSSCLRHGGDGAEVADMDLEPFSDQDWDQALAPLTQLRELELSSNDLEAVPDCVLGLSGLQKLQLLNNHYLTELPRGPYQQALLSLNLNDCGSLMHRHIVPFLSGLTRLTELCLAGVKTASTVSARMAARRRVRSLYLPPLPRLRVLELSEGLKLVKPERFPGLRITLPRSLESTFHIPDPATPAFPPLPEPRLHPELLSSEEESSDDEDF